MNNLTNDLKENKNKETYFNFLKNLGIIKENITFENWLINQNEIN